MKLSLQKIEKAMFKKKLRMIDVSRRAGKCPSWMTKQIARAAAGGNFKPVTAREIATAIGCRLEDILADSEIVITETAPGVAA
jgi:hypothetical protein